MPPKYVPVSVEQIREKMKEIGFVEVLVYKTYELVFERVSKVPDLTIRIYSSINPDVQGIGGGSREAGTDAGRVVLVEKTSGKIVWSSKRAHRTASFLQNLAERAREAWRAVATLQTCPVCHGYMVLRKSRQGKGHEFYGCLKYPGCHGTRPSPKKPKPKWVRPTPTSKVEPPKSNPTPASQDGGVI